MIKKPVRNDALRTGFFIKTNWGIILTTIKDKAPKTHRKSAITYIILLTTTNYIPANDKPIHIDKIN